MLSMINGDISLKGNQDAPINDVFKVGCLWVYITQEPGTPFKSCLIHVITYNVFHTGGLKSIYNGLPGLMMSMLKGTICFKGSQDALIKDVFKVECLWVYIKRESGTPSYILFDSSDNLQCVPHWRTKIYL